MTATTYCGSGAAEGSTISADTESQYQHKYLDYINRGADVSAAAREDVACGEYSGPAQEYQFATGKQTGRRYSDNRSHWAWTTGLTKVQDVANSNVAANWAILNKPEWQDLFGAGVRIFLEADAFVFVHAFIEIHTPQNNEYGRTWDLNDLSLGSYRQVPSLVKVLVDTTQYAETIGYAFEEVSAAGLSSEPDPDGPSGASTSGKYRMYQLQFGANLTAGYHTIKVQVDCRNERTYAAARNFCVEAIYSANHKDADGYFTATP